MGRPNPSHPDDLGGQIRSHGVFDTASHRSVPDAIVSRLAASRLAGLEVRGLRRSPVTVPAGGVRANYL